MLCIREDESKQTGLICVGSALWYVLRYLDLWRKRLRAGWGERAPGVEFAIGPVSVGGANGPAAKLAVCLVDRGPFGEEVAWCIGELTMADVVLVHERVVF